MYDYKVEENEKKKTNEFVQEKSVNSEEMQFLNDEILQLQKMLDEE